MKMSAGFVLLFVIVVFTPDYAISAMTMGRSKDRHGGVKMGVSSDDCDNGKDMISVDWDNSEDEYTCYKNTLNPGNEEKVTRIVDAHDESPIHVCLPTPIHYKVAIPTSGSHRPLWPKYGEYQYVPPQRWVHSLEHGAAIFLYHPCVDQQQLALFKEIAFNCLKKIIITPYKHVPESQPFVVVTYQAKLMMNKVERGVIGAFIRETVWQRSSEKDVWRDGTFSVGLIKSSYVGSTLEDNYRNLCPERS